MRTPFGFMFGSPKPDLIPGSSSAGGEINYVFDYPAAEEYMTLVFQPAEYEELVEAAGKVGVPVPDFVMEVAMKAASILNQKPTTRSTGG